jgi:predicted nucleic acid-binding protein
VNVVDSSGWLEYFADASNAGFFAAPIEDTARLIVPALSLVEVTQRILQQRDEPSALTALALMCQGQAVDLDPSLAFDAAQLGVELKLALAGSIMLATARRHGAMLWTQDADFEGFAGVKYRKKR